MLGLAAVWLFHWAVAERMRFVRFMITEVSVCLQKQECVDKLVYD